MLVRSLLAYSILLLAAAQPRSLLAQYQKYEGQPVADIRFAPAEQPLVGAELFEMLPLKRGQTLRMSEVRASVCSANPGLAPSFRRSLPETGCRPRVCPTG